MAEKKEEVKEVEIKLPRAEKGENNFITASLNGKVYQIKRGIPVTVPVALAEIIKHSEEAKDAAIDYIDSRKSE